MNRQIADLAGTGQRIVSPLRPPRRTAWLASWLGAACLAAAGLAQAGGVGICRVTTDGVTGNDGSSWAQAMPLQAALGNTGCLELWVAKGVYKPTSDITDPAVSFAIRPGVAVYGGFTGTETSREQRDPAAHHVVLSADIGGDDTVDAEGVTKSAFDVVGTNAYHVVRLGGGTLADTVLDGFTLTGGKADRNDISLEEGAGGGLLCNADGAGQVCSPTLRNLVFSGNLGYSGGGMTCLGQNQGTCAARLENVAFVGNLSLGGGGMMSAGLTGGTSNPTLDNATFSGNFAAFGGAGFSSNGSGGGSSNPILRNATFNGNDTSIEGSSGTGGAIASGGLSGTSHVTLVNAILWGDIPDEVLLRDGTVTLDHGIVQGGCPVGVSCTGTIVGDPQLGVLQYMGSMPVLLPGTGSAALDAVACDNAPAGDQRGVARPQGAACDVGAVEVRQAHVVVAVSGAGMVGALATPPPLGAPIADCREDQGSCDAWYLAEAVTPAVTLTLHPDAGSELLSASGCGGTITGGGSTFTTGTLTGDCSMAVVFAPAVRAIGGTATGLAGSGLVLALNGSEESLPIAADGGFAFVTAVAQGEAFAVTVGTQPTQPAQSCAVINGSGTVGDSDITNVVVNCGAAVTYAVGGTVSGLAPGGSVSLSINGGNGLTLAANGAYAFAPRFAPGDGYLATVTAQPDGQHCTLDHAEGMVGSANVADVDVDCTAGGAQLQLGVTDGGDYARYGQVRDYFVTLGNVGNGPAANIAIGADLDSAFDEANVQWACVGGAPGTACTAQGAGGFADTATLPAGTSLVWIVRVPVRGDSTAAEGVFHAHASGAADASDADTLVIFRDGVDVPYADGAGVVDPARSEAALEGGDGAAIEAGSSARQGH
jgi:hypothetical protein